MKSSMSDLIKKTLFGDKYFITHRYDLSSAIKSDQNKSGLIKIDILNQLQI